jgi:hypothetical protein
MREKLRTESGKQRFPTPRTMPHIAETFVLAVAHSELNYCSIPLPFLVVFFAVLCYGACNNICITFLSPNDCKLSV